MLQWLTLTVLWSTTLSAGQQMYGTGGGKYFSTSPDSENDISGIRVSISPIGILKSIQVKYGPSWSEVFGFRVGNTQEFILLPGEHIVGAYGTYGLYLRYLTIFTDFGRMGVFGKDAGQSFMAYPEEPEDVLRGLSGQVGGLGITSIGFKWGNPAVEFPTDQQTNQTLY